MEVQGANAVMAAVMVGADNSSQLSFMAQVRSAEKAYEFSTVPGVTYLGSPISLTSSGTFDQTADVFHMSSTASFAGTSWTGTGMATIAGDPNGNVNLSFNVPGIGNVSWMSQIIYTTLGSGAQISRGTWSLIVGDRTFGGSGRDVLQQPLPMDGPPGPARWVWLTEQEQPLSGLPFKIESEGVVSPDGATSSFETTITTVPEPYSVALWVIGSFLFPIAHRMYRRQKHETG